jgi:hypothetical protein
MPNPELFPILQNIAKRPSNVLIAEKASTEKGRIGGTRGLTIRSGTNSTAKSKDVTVEVPRRSTEETGCWHTNVKCIRCPKDPSSPVIHDLVKDQVTTRSEIVSRRTLVANFVISTSKLSPNPVNSISSGIAK